jgi:hypothetical protein
MQIGWAVGAFVASLLVSQRVTAFSVLAAVSAAAFTAVIVSRRLGPLARSSAHDARRFSIVPWGVVVHADEMPRVLRWAAIREISVEGVHGMDHATPSTRWSVVTIRTERETFGGRAPGAVELESLEANFERYAAEAARPLALDLDGCVPLEDLLEPSFERLLSEARRLMASGELSERLALEPKSYRDAGSAPCPETRRALRAVLESSSDAKADARALAAVLAAELGAVDLSPAVTGLTLSPNPVVAAVARGAALRLGAGLAKVGALDELSEFVPEGDLSDIRAWAGAPRVARLSARLS